MQSTITSKYQTTIPKAIREKMGLAMKDALEWKIEKGKVMVYSVKANFLKYRNTIKIGQGDIEADVEASRNLRIEKHR